MINGIKKLKFILPNRAARDSVGRISVRGRGGRQKRYYRIIDWKRDKHDLSAEVIRIEYDPNRSCNVALVQYTDGELRYILHPKKLLVGSIILSGEKAEIKPGHSMPLQKIPVGVAIHNIELVPGQGGILARSAGNSAVIVGKDEKFTLVKLPSGEIRKVSLNCYATIGQLDNEGKKHDKIGKAGRRRYHGRRPKVRGVAMHPGAHPHGGGEGRSGEGMHPKTPWGKPAKGLKTRQKKKASNSLIVKRRK